MRERRILWEREFTFNGACYRIRVTCGSTPEQLAWETGHLLFWLGVLSLIFWRHG